MAVDAQLKHARRREFLDGVRAELPLALGVVPFGLIYGALAVDLGIDPLPAYFMSIIVFAGSSQFIGARLISAGTAPIVVIATTFVVNLRHALYSVSLAPSVRHLTRGWRGLLAYLLTDEAYAPTAVRYRSGDNEALRHWFFFGAAAMLWTSWQIATVVGVVAGGRVPDYWALDFTLALTFIGITIPLVRTRPTLAAALTAAAIAVLTVDMPNRVGLLIAALAGVAVGYALELARKGGDEPTVAA
jgi:4-azaleucine resistance transporter AzlC